MFIILVVFLLNRLKRQKRFQLLNSEPDGLCFYSSFLKHLNTVDHGDKNLTPIELKTKIYNTYKEQNGEVRFLNILDPTKNYWATDEIAQIVANIYGIHIFIREKLSGNWTWTQIQSVKKNNDYETSHVSFQHGHDDYMRLA